MVDPTEYDDERQENGSYNNTRRQFVAGSAGALGGLAAGGAFVGPAFAQEDDEEDEGEPEEEEEEEETAESEFEDDVDILNYALTLEYLEAEFYRQALENISEEDLCNCRALMGHSQVQETVYEELETILAHEEAHVEAIVQTIEDNDGEPIEEPEFDFGVRVEYPMPFLSTAALLEDAGVSAYAGAAPSIESEEVLPSALGIHSVEARHASFVRRVNNQTGFPNVVDEARSRSEIEEIASSFIVGEEGDPDDIDEEEFDGEPDGNGEPDEETDDDEESDEEPDESGESDDAETPDENVTDTPGETITDFPDVNETS